MPWWDYVVGGADDPIENRLSSELRQDDVPDREKARSNAIAKMIRDRQRLQAGLPPETVRNAPATAQRVMKEQALLERQRNGRPADFSVTLPIERSLASDPPKRMPEPKKPEPPATGVTTRELDL